MILYAALLSRASGTSERIVQIAKGLATHNVKITLSGALQGSVEELALKNVNVIKMPNRIQPSFKILKWVVELISSGLSHKYDIVQIESFSFARTLALYFLMRPFTRKFTIVFHDNLFQEDPRLNLLGRIALNGQRFLLILFDAVITPGDSVKNWFVNLHGSLAEEKMVVIPNGVPTFDNDAKIDKSTLRKGFGVDPNDYVALFYGSMTFKPNHDAASLLLSISKYACEKFLERTGKKLVLAIAGIGSKGFPVNEYFVSLGFVKNLDELLFLPDVIVFPHPPSHSGPHVKTLYAFQSGKPVVATEDAIKGLPNLKENGHFILFDAEKPETLIDALVFLYRNPESGKVLTLNARLYSEKITWTSVSYTHISLFKRILDYPLVER